MNRSIRICFKSGAYLQKGIAMQHPMIDYWVWDLWDFTKGAPTQNDQVV